MYRYSNNNIGVGSGSYTYFWKSKGVPDKNIKLFIISNHNFTPELNYFGSAIRVKFHAGCLKQDKLHILIKKAVNINITYELNFWTYSPATDFTSKNSLFEAVKLTKNDDPNKYGYSGYGIGFDTRGKFSVGNGFGWRFIILGVYMGSSVYVENKKKDVLILKEGPTQGLNGTTLTA